MHINKRTERIFTFSVIFILLLLSGILLIVYYKRGIIPRSELFYNGFSIFCTSGIGTYLLFIGNFKIDLILENRLPWNESIFKRLIAEYVLIVVYSLSVMSLIGICLYFGFDVEQEGYFKSLLIQTLIVVLIITTIVTLTGFVQGWRDAQLNIQKLEKETANARYEALKANIKPHFLFNSLNTLTSLIQVNPGLAEEYSEGLSDVYRYILKSNDELLASVKDEVEFLKVYLNLQQIRFGDSLDFNINISSEDKEKLIPSLSLQLLVENAMKHNIVDKKNKLALNICSNDNYLEIRNNYQPKKSKPISIGFGTKNIEERYSYFTDIKPVFNKTESEYIVKIPLLDD